MMLQLLLIRPSYFLSLINYSEQQAKNDEKHPL